MPPRTTNVSGSLPRGIKLRHTLRGQSEILTRVAWLAKGRVLATPSNDGSIWIWDPGVGEVRRKLVKHVRDANGVSLSPDGRTLASAGSDNSIVLWDLAAGTPQRTLLKHAGDVNQVGWLLDGELMASVSNDRTVLVWDTERWEPRAEFAGHRDKVYDLAVAPDRRRFATASHDRTVRIWTARTDENSLLLRGHAGFVATLAWTPDGAILASGGEDATIFLWDANTGRTLRRIQGHTGFLTGLSFSADGRLLASKSADDTVRIWRCDSWETVAVIAEPASAYMFEGLAFHPTAPVLATLGEKDRVARIWDIDVGALLNEASDGSTSVRYTNAKVVLVGDSGAGKSGLGLVLTGQPFAPTESTHGRRVWGFDTHKAALPDGLEETRETLLWDLAGQPGYRLIHQLHLNEVTVALIVFDSCNDVNPLAGVLHWDRALRQAERIRGDSAMPLKKLLVAARVDRGGVGLSPARITEIKHELGVDEYFETSAKEGWNIPELIEAIRHAIDWESLPKVNSTTLFQGIKEFLLTEKEGGRLFATMDDLFRAFLRSADAPAETPELRAQFKTGIGQVESLGFIRRLSFGDFILLQPEILDGYASAMVDAAKSEMDGLGCIAEEDAQCGRFRMPDSERLADKTQEKLLLIATIEDLIRHEIALREQTDAKTMLVFPSQFTRERPDLPEPEDKTVIFRFEGPVLNLYARLAVRLSHSGGFKRQEMWKNAASYQASVGGSHGLFLREIQGGQGELTLFFDQAASEQTRFQFEEYVHAHLRRWALPASIQRRRIFTCPVCRTPVSDLQAQRRLERKLKFICCGVCDDSVRVSLLDQENRLATPAPSTVPEMDLAADAKRRRDTVATILRGKIAAGHFDVFLAHSSDDKPAVRTVAEKLQERGLNPWFDEWNLPPGRQFVKEIEAVLPSVKSVAVFVGPGKKGPWVENEYYAVLNLYVKNNRPIIPVLLPNTVGEPDLPAILSTFSWVRFGAQLDDCATLDKLQWGITGESPRRG